jgi:alpha-1,4-galacturonosyltransferase
MQLRISPSMRSITISSSNGVVDSMKVRVAPQPPPPPPPPHGSGRRGGGGGWGAGWYWRAVAFPAVVALGCLLPFAFILAAVPALEAGGSKCSSIGKIDGARSSGVVFFFVGLGLVAAG